jgi:hypothetical protein
LTIKSETAGSEWPILSILFLATPVCISKRSGLYSLVKNFWIDNRTPEDDDYATPIGDDLIMMKMKKELTILPNGHIQLPTLWKDGQLKTQNNYEYAKNRLFSLLGSKSMTSNDNLLKYYGEVGRGYIERVIDPNPTRPNLWYWAHFPIIKSEKETTKIRPVFDGAAKFRELH